MLVVQTLTQRWQAVQCCIKCERLFDPGGIIGICLFCSVSRDDKRIGNNADKNVPPAAAVLIRKLLLEGTLCSENGIGTCAL